MKREAEREKVELTAYPGGPVAQLLSVEMKAQQLTRSVREQNPLL